MEVDEIRRNGALTLDLAKSTPCLIEETNQDCTGVLVAVDQIREASPRVDDADKPVLAEINSILDTEEARQPTLQLKRRRGVSSSGVPRRKPRKMRFLSELLSRTENLTADHTKGAHDNPTPEEATTLATYTSKRKRKIPPAPSRETPSTNNEAKDAKEFQGDTESTAAILGMSDSESTEDASSTGMCWESTYKPIEQTGDTSGSSKLKGKMPPFEDGQMQQEKAMPNFEIGESSTANSCFGEGMLQLVNETIARTAEILRQQNCLPQNNDGNLNLHKQLSGKSGNMSAAVAPNHSLAGSVGVPQNYPSNSETHEQCKDLNKGKKIMEFDLNFPASNDEVVDVAALQLLGLRDRGKKVLGPESDELKCTVNRNPAEFSHPCEENEYFCLMFKEKEGKKENRFGV